jgi:hypothetical protein
MEKQTGFHNACQERSSTTTAVQAFGTCHEPTLFAYSSLSCDSQTSHNNNQAQAAEFTESRL